MHVSAGECEFRQVHMCACECKVSVSAHEYE